MSERVFSVEVNDGDTWGIFDYIVASSEEEAIEVAYSNCDSDEVDILNVWEVDDE